MKQFGKILKFELKGYLANKVFIGITVFLVAAIAIVMFFPRISALIKQDEEKPEDEKGGVMLVSAQEPYSAAVVEAFGAAFEGYEVRFTDGSADEIQQQISNGEAQCAFVIDDLTNYSYYVDNLSMYDSNTAIADEVLLALFRLNAMAMSGIAIEDAQGILTTQINHSVYSLGKDQIQNFFYTYIMIFALYMVILLYGQMVATNVATEKSSRAMEVLITSADPVSMMFGKVIASCTAGLIQLIAVFGSAFVLFNVNRSYMQEGGMMAMIFDMPIDLVLYMLLFFVLGFLIYAFLFGAIGSTASKLEDINTSSQPVTFLFVIAFVVVMFSMASGNVDTLIMKICSYVPFTSPMAMFTRIAMSTVPWWEIVVSVVILVVSTVFIGVVAAKIYRIGVLLYGTPPKPRAILQAIRKS